MSWNRLLLKGKRFGRLLVVEDLPAVKHKGYCLCLCDCGNTCKVANSELRTGDTKSCGCLKRECPSAKTHGLTDTRTYNAWRAMHQRCTNAKLPSFKNYGGRGITVCERWHDFAAFLQDMGECPPGLSIDRYPDKDGNYEPGNCRWATPAQQSRNTRRNRIFTVRGVTGCLKDVCHELGLDYYTIHSRLRRGMSEDLVFNEDNINRRFYKKP